MEQKQARPLTPEEQAEAQKNKVLCGKENVSRMHKSI